MAIDGGGPCLGEGPIVGGVHVTGDTEAMSGVGAEVGERPCVGDRAQAGPTPVTKEALCEQLLAAPRYQPVSHDLEHARDRVVGQVADAPGSGRS